MVLSVIVLMKIVDLYGHHLQLAPDLDDKRSLTIFRKQLFGSASTGDLNNWKRGVPIWGLFAIRVGLTYAFVVLNLPLLFLFIFTGFLSYINLRFIDLAGENTWIIFNYLIQVLTYLIIFANYFYIIWVELCIIFYIVLLFVLLADLDFIVLQAFIPDVLAIMAFYSDPIYQIWVLPIALMSFIYNFSVYVLVF